MTTDFFFNMGKHNVDRNFHFNPQNWTLNKQKAGYLLLDTLLENRVHCYHTLMLKL